MSATHTLRRQHTTLLELASQLRKTAQKVETIDQASDCSRTLAKLTGILRIHLAAEDNSLYPRMIASQNGEAAETARKYYEQMGGLAEVYLDYEANWRSGGMILEGLDQFRQETDIVLTALSNRIECENSVLYPLADSVFAPQNLNAA